MTVLTVLRQGRPSALRKKDLAARLGVPTRVVEKEIEAIRKAGRVAICSDSVVGYWLPATLEEYEANLRNRRTRAIHQLITNRGERRCAAEWKARDVEQQPLWDAA